jgi:hypothetical protein
VERLDWKAQIVLRKKSRKSWDAVQQLLRYREVVGEDAPISTQPSENEELLGARAQSRKSIASDNACRNIVSEEAVLPAGTSFVSCRRYARLRLRRSHR